MCAETRPAHTEIIFYYTVSVLFFQEERKEAKKREEKSLHFSGKPAIIKAQKNMDDVQRVRRKSAAEWGEKPRERVTVIPENRLSQIHRVLCAGSCPHRDAVTDRIGISAQQGAVRIFLFLLSSRRVCRTLFLRKHPVSPCRGRWEQEAPLALREAHFYIVRTIRSAAF